MARPINYATPEVDDRAAEREVEDLVAALHESGLLRALTGAVRSYPELLQLVVRRLDADTLRSMFTLTRVHGRLDPEATERLVRAGESATAAASDTLRRPGAPSPLTVLRSVADPDVRRGLGAVLAGLGALGRSLRA